VRYEGVLRPRSQVALRQQGDRGESRKLLNLQQGAGGHRGVEEREERTENWYG